MPDYSGAPPRAPLARRAGWPLYRQIAADLRRQIEDGELRPGDPVPSEQALVERFGVSRGTVRQARATLRADGTIGGSQGKPLAVHGATLTQPLGELISFSAWVRSLGKQPSGRVLHLSAAPAAADLAEQVGVAAGGTVYHLERLRLADDEPLMMERTCFPEAIGRLLVGIDLDRESVYAALAACGIVVASARHRIDAIAADAEDAALLGVDPGAALLRVRRHAFAASGAPIEWSDDRYRGDRTDFSIENGIATPTLTRRLAARGD